MSTSARNGIFGTIRANAPEGTAPVTDYGVAGLVGGAAVGVLVGVTDQTLEPIHYTLAYALALAAGGYVVLADDRVRYNRAWTGAIYAGLLFALSEGIYFLLRFVDLSGPLLAIPHAAAWWSIFGTGLVVPSVAGLFLADAFPGLSAAIAAYRSPSPSSGEAQADRQTGDTAEQTQGTAED